MKKVHCQNKLKQQQREHNKNVHCQKRKKLKQNNKNNKEIRSTLPKQTNKKKTITTIRIKLHRSVK